MRRFLVFGALISAPLLFVLADTSAEAPDAPGSSPTAVVSNSHTLASEMLAAQILEAKSRGYYDDALWTAYFGDMDHPRGPGERLDQGGETFATATLIPALPYNDFGQTFGTNNDYYEDCMLPGPDMAGDVVYRYNAPVTQAVDISLCGGPPGFDARLYVYENAYTPGNPYACSDDACNLIQPEIVALTLHSANAYYLVIDGWGASMGPYLLTVTPRPPVTPCPCPFPEQEPNDVLPPLQAIHLGEHFCGTIARPNDVDYVALDLTQPTAIQVTLLGGGATGTCPGGQGLHPYVAILTEDGEDIAFAGDTTNQATTFTSDFPFGPFRYLLKIAGARGTTGPYELLVNAVAMPTVPPPVPQVTLYEEGGSVRLRWQQSYLPGESVRIDVSANFDGPYGTMAIVPGLFGSYLVPVTTETRFFRVTAIGARPRDPCIGAVMSVAEPGDNYGEGQEVAQFVVQEIEWAVAENNDLVIARLVAQGLPPHQNEMIVQDQRADYGYGLTPISGFSGHYLNLEERRVLLDYVAFARDPVNGGIGIIDGRGRVDGNDSLHMFSGITRYLEPNNGGVSENWVGWGGLWGFNCHGRCCDLRVWAFCRQFASWAAACAGPRCPGNPRCWLGCPCEPDPAFICTLPPPGCSPCEMRIQGLIRWCICPLQTPPPPIRRCIWQPWVRCKPYECPAIPNCDCEVGACPGPARWTPVPFVNRAMRLACRRFCT